MPRLLTAFTLLTLVALLVFSCGGPPKKPAPPDKASGPVVAKGTTTTDLPEGGEPTMPPRSYTTEEYVARLMKDQGMEDRPGSAPVPAPQPAEPPIVPAVPAPPAVPEAPVVPAAPAPDLPVVPEPVVPAVPAPYVPAPASAPGVEPAKYPAAPAAGAAPAGGPVEPAKYPAFQPKATGPAAGVEPAKYPGKPAPMPGPAPVVEPMPLPPAPEPTPPPPVPAAPTVEPVPPVVAPAPPPVPVAPPPPAYESEADRRMRELAERKRVELQYEEYLVNYYVGQAETHFGELRYPEAEEWILKALERQPDNQKAIELYQKILAAQGRRAGEIPSAQTELQRLHEVKIQEAKAQAAHYFSEGEKAYNAKLYDDAIKNFDNVLTIIDNAPYGIDWGTMKSDANDFLFRCRQDKVKYEELLAKDRARQALDDVRKEELKRKQAAEDRINKLLTEAIDAFENERFDLAESLAEQVLSLDPMNARAREILDQSVRARHLAMSDSLLRATKERFREWRIDIRDTTIPWSDRPLEWPNQREWDRISRRAAALTDLDISSEMDPADQALKNRLQQEIVSFSFENATMPEALDVLRQLKNINIVIDDKVKSDLEAAPVTLTVTSLEFESHA
ncbi:MAG: hypothetical protein MUE73_02370 [Planctomycetes bacterium]|nr:hypothetical protein [Planctomycetota bacterium]